MEPSQKSELRLRALFENQRNQDPDQGPATPKKSKGHRMVNQYCMVISCNPTGNPSAQSNKGA